jgi:uncharacterized protein
MKRDTISGWLTGKRHTSGRRLKARALRGTAAPPGQKIQAARRASAGSQTLTNLQERLEDLDKEGIDVQYLYPSFLLHINAWPDGILAMGVCRAYNTWLAEACRKAPDRLKGVGVVSLQDPDGAARELPRIQELGMTAVMINGPRAPRGWIIHAMIRFFPKPIA